MVLFLGFLLKEEIIILGLFPHFVISTLVSLVYFPEGIIYLILQRCFFKFPLFELILLALISKQNFTVDFGSITTHFW